MLKVIKGLCCTNEVQTSMLLKKFRIEGRERIMVVADFDYTLTLREDDNGHKGCLTHEVFQTIRNEQAGCSVEILQHAMNKYYETMLSRCNSKDQCTFVQVEWWNASHDIIVQSKVHRDQLSNLVRNSKLIWRNCWDNYFPLFLYPLCVTLMRLNKKNGSSHQLQFPRKNTCQFMKLLEEMSIPLLIYSAGITDIIEEAIRQLLGYFPNIVTVAANRMRFDEHGYITGFTNPPVCSLNKTVARLRGGLVQKVDDAYFLRTNVLLIGDSEADACMLDGWEKKKLKIGLLEEKVPHLHAFDIVIRGSDCTRLIEIVKFITSYQEL